MARFDVSAIPRKLPVIEFFPPVFATKFQQDMYFPIRNAADQLMQYFIAVSKSAEGHLASTGVLCHIEERQNRDGNLHVKATAIFQVVFDLKTGEMRSGRLFVVWNLFRLHPVSVVDLQIPEFYSTMQAFLYVFQRFIEVLEEHESEHRKLLDSGSMTFARKQSLNLSSGLDVQALNRILHCVMDVIAMLFTTDAEWGEKPMDPEKQRPFRDEAHAFLAEHFVKNRITRVTVLLGTIVGIGEKKVGTGELAVGGESPDGTAEHTAEDFKRRFEEVKQWIPKEKWSQIQREITYAQGEGSNAQVSQRWLDHMLWMPWGVFTEDAKELSNVQKILDEDHEWLKNVKSQIVEFVAIRTLNPKAKGSILCLVGPPGVGKTSVAKSIARALGRKYVRISLGGVHDEGELRGHRRTYIGSEPGKIATAIRDAGSFNPLIVLDEIDKVGAHFGREDMQAGLLEILDPEQNAAFVDHYHDMPYDLSQVMFLPTANLTDPITPALLDRMTVIRLTGYTPQEKIAIAAHHLIPKQKKECGIPADHEGKKLDAEIASDAIPRIIAEYTYEAGVRNLEKTIHRIFAKIDADFLLRSAEERTDTHVVVTGDNLTRWCGKPEYQDPPVPDRLGAGIVPALGVTEKGGHVFLFEITLGDQYQERKIKLTGIRAPHDSKESVNKIEESLQIAFGYFSSRDGILYDCVSACEKDRPLYVQGNLTDDAPKDGPSAGVAAALALYGALTKQPMGVRLAATGTVSLSGAVGAVGGIRDKVLAAHRAGIRTVIIPTANAADLDDIPDDVRTVMTAIPVSEIREALRAAFPDDERLKKA